jgi:hypothetical protein
MMFDQDLPNYLWEKDTSIVMYIQNRCPHDILKEKSPEEIFSGIKPEVGNLRIFGCLVYIHVPKEKRKIWNPQERKGFLWGIVRTPRLT